jgi:hypothetical protein
MASKDARQLSLKQHDKNTNAGNKGKERERKGMRNGMTGS